MSVALVTGAGHGIGRAIAIDLAAEGHHAVVGYHSDHDGAQSVVAHIEAQGGSASAAAIDVTDPASVAALFATFGQDLEAPEVVVANAAAVDNALVSGMSDEQFHRVVNTCLYGSFSVFRASLPAMRRRGSGRLVAVTSAAGIWGRRGAANYAAAKAGIHGLVRSLAKETGRWGVTVNAVAPGVIDTSGVTSLDPSTLGGQADWVALRRLGTCEEVSAVVKFLASPAASYVTGEVVVVDGGVGP